MASVGVISQDSRTITMFGRAVFLLLLIQLQSVAATTVRGVSITKLSLYSPDKDFTCLDGSQTIPFANVNDDYCDCSDGSDEPGTSACRNGHFHCTNAGHRPLYIPSSRVNDNICDCCDGTDEYDGGVACENMCKELGKEERERLEKERTAALEGVRIKVEYSKQGKDVKTEKQSKLSLLQEELQAHKTSLDALRTAKESVEEPEKLAKEKHEKEWQEVKAANEEERNTIEATDAFTLLDTNKDGVLLFAELQSNDYLTKDLTQEEWKEYFGEIEDVIVPHLIATWSRLKPIYAATGRSTEAPVDEKTSEPSETVDATMGETPLEPPHMPDAENIPGVDDGDDGDDDDDTGDTGAGGQEPTQSKEEDAMPEYDEETKQLIAAADEARRQFDEAQRKHDDTDKEIKDIEKVLGYDFGEHEEFYPLYGQCFEYQDREYIYKLCPFDRSSQESKSGGASTSLGNWDNWTGPPNDKYSEMNFKDGQSCWNGPNRSVKVSLHCGTENKVISVDEPNRCEYTMQFTSPALCHEGLHRAHEEL